MSDQSRFKLSVFADWLQIPKKRQKHFLLQILLFYFAVVLILILDTGGIRSDVTEGMVCQKTIRSPRNISFVDERKTNELKRAEEEKIQPSVEPIKNAIPEMLARMSKFLENSQAFYSDFDQRTFAGEGEEIIASYFPNDALLRPEQIKELLSLDPFDFERLKQASLQILKNLNQQDITSNNFETVAGKTKPQVDDLPGGKIFKRLLVEIVRNGLTVNAIEDIEQTKIRREAAKNSITDVIKTFQKGQKIIDEGVVITADDINVLKAVDQQIHKNLLLAFLGNTLLTGLIIVIFLLHLRLVRPSLLKDSGPIHLLGSLWIGALILGKLVYTFGNAYDQSTFAILLSPLPAIGLLMAILLDSQIAIFHQMLLGILLFAISEGNAKIAILSLLGGVIGILAWSFSSKSGNIRHQIGFSGVTIGLANAIVVLSLLVLDSENFSLISMSNLAMVLGCGFGNGIISGIIANGVLPYLETFFALATSSKFLELADLSQPILKRLAEEAPGTHHHSLMVGTLAEAAAKEIDADILLTKIGSYYHDIGKLKRPLYFAENQSDRNQHDQLTPYMSSLILVGHIRDGLEIAREYSLPEQVIPFISQHHGTTLISYFFQQAKSDTDGQEVNEGRFRYPGPKPQKKETAIVMLADSIEAAVRTLPQHTRGSIEGLVKKIIENKFNDENQLDESDLTLKDIEKIEQTFIRVLTSMYHGRVDYPGKLSNQPKGGSSQ